MSKISWFQFRIKQTSSISAAMKELSSLPIKELSILSDVEQGEKLIYGAGSNLLFPKSWQHIQAAISLEGTVDWEEQWRLFCPYFKDGLCRIPLSAFLPEGKQELWLKPGAGFGDLSHPTTHLVLSSLPKYVQNKTVLDLGCGSGILGIAALLWGAKYAYSIDIEPEAILHTKHNAQLNGVQEMLFASATLPSPSPYIDILLLNMTFAEQKQALSSLPFFSSCLWITSGLLQEQEKEYLDFVSSFGMNLVATQSKDGWLSFIFSHKQDKK